MSQHNLVTVDLNSSRSNPPSRYAGRSPRKERSRVCSETARMSQERQRPSGDSPRAVAARPWSLPSKTTTADRRVALAMPAMSFGPFHVLPNQRLLLQGDRPVRLGSRALDILVALVERTGELVSKGELMARVWPDTFVEESNLKVQVAALRRTLRDGEDGSRYISTVTGRGYWFVAPVVRSTGMNGEASD
jgi:DNA-binding winged helix-turn-helix (wHTH) protein